MNKNQRIVLFAAAAIILAMLIYPPWAVSRDFRAGRHSVGYRWITTPPRYEDAFVRVEVELLVVQWAGVLLLAGLAFFALKDDK